MWSCAATDDQDMRLDAFLCFIHRSTVRGIVVDHRLELREPVVGIERQDAGLEVFGIIGVERLGRMGARVVGRGG